MSLGLTDTKLRLKTEPKHANKSRVEWMKAVKCRKCSKKGHMARFCRTTKKNWIKTDDDEVDENEASGDEKFENKGEN